MAGPEATIERAAQRWVVSKGGVMVKVRGIISWPDRLVITRNGAMFLCEFKAPGRIPAPAQAYTMNKLRQMGVMALWADNLDNFKVIYERAEEMAAEAISSKRDILVNFKA